MLFIANKRNERGLLASLSRGVVIGPDSCSRGATQMQGEKHEPVMLAEAVDALAIRARGIYLDATLGRGGHTQAILDRVGATGRLLAIDKDPEAVAAGVAKFFDDSRVSIWQGTFAAMDQAMRAHDITMLDGVLMDLGVSSPQLDNPARGFSFQHDGPLDMRMNPKLGLSAAEWLAQAEESDIARVLWEFGEERFARRIARAIVTQRAKTPLTGTAALASLITAAVPRRDRNKHPATRSFQGIRIHVNAELAELDQGLQAARRALAPGGRLVVISFHSLEDRLVKRFIRRESGTAKGQRRLPAPLPMPATMKPVGRILRPNPSEMHSNPRARSAVMRVAERLS